MTTTPKSAQEGERGATIKELWQDLLDKDDRTSPSEYPDMCLITFEEFADYMQAAWSAQSSRIAELQADAEHHDKSFDLRWNADMRASKRWQEATGKTMTLPDYADLCVWLLGQLEAPIDMILFCPLCGVQHVDEPEDVSRTTSEFGPPEAWENPPHRSHLCHGCGHIWRPCDRATNGVKAIETVGKADSPRVDPTALESQAELYRKLLGEAAEAMASVAPATLSDEIERLRAASEGKADV